SDRMGLGEGTFKVNRDTELRPVMPNQVIEGDRFHAGFSVMNRTDAEREITVSLNAEGAVRSGADGSAPKREQTVSVPPYKRVLVWLPVTAAADGKIRFTATAGDELDRDALAHAVPVLKRQALQTSATYGTTTADSVTETIAFPQDMRADTGEAGVVVSPSVIGNAEGAFTYMKDYPYSCWEQKLTRGTMASHYLDLKDYVPDTFGWPGSDTLPPDMLGQAANYQAPNGGMVYYVPADHYVSPYLSAYTALAFNWLRAAGHTVPADVEQRLHEYLSLLLRRDVVPDFYSKGMASTVRAAALAGLAAHGKVTLDDVRRYHAHVPQMSLFGKALYLQASLAARGSEDIRAEVAKLILSHANQSGGKFVFNEALDTRYQRILASPLRSNCAVLSALSAYGETDAGAQLVADAPFKLVRTITQTRGNRDHWENTQENMFCMNALIEYSRVYETEAPDMQIVASLSGEALGQASFDDLRDSAQTLARPVREGDPGQRADLHIERAGSGRVYYSARLAYSPKEPRAEPTNAGIEIHREYSVERDGRWQLLSAPMQLERGELVRVDLYASLPTARNFVVVDDPVPGGLEPVNRDLATASIVDADKGAFRPAGGSRWYRFNDWYGFATTRWSFYHQELRHDAARFYSDYLPPGNYHLSYTAQVIAPGEFEVLPAKAEEMYDPDVFGLTGPSRLAVELAE
ncbi:MAG: large extracellular alpha-helical protein, partial [Gammaproteobacteria bacterium]